MTTQDLTTFEDPCGNLRDSMLWESKDVLAVLDQCSASFTFPMLDNGYVYLAATRLSAHRTEVDWGLVVEIFGYSPRAETPDTQIYTFASTLHNRDPEQKYVNRQAYEHYLKNNPHNESRFVFPIDDGDWQGNENSEFVAHDARTVTLRGQAIKLPSVEEYGRHGIELQRPPRIHKSELCRFLAEIERDRLLASSEESRVSLQPEMQQVLRLDEWNHPNLVQGELPSRSETFQQLAQVLVTGEPGAYRPSQPANTHWKNWPDGGSL